MIQTAKLLTLPLSFLLAGYGFHASHSSVPVLYDMPAEHSTPAFTRIFHNGAYFVVPSSLICSISTAYLAYTLPSQRTLWSIACGAQLLTLPWTAVVMLPGINKLIAISQSKVKQEKATASLEARQLLTRWNAQNAVRASLFLVAGLAALRAMAGSI
ncbi:hypothetical protein BAUCODRAFT_76104 [Baudoinia panamericana UAMH 10762]|uniref:DUF1772 domain-containing protein n=1 Tax=Baudoinia panamericana (strain UAMH 10762) TaxID=717646 RepID=M2MAA0_BAUPA|nr:uncharacterized protein BAUCODRAFT_76104 [Baudoinia panamericana UAMH 10762]EMC93401.1 hypothetical protein BAUCODRAFT_76104 [Baudoinia panamericana UAMH 10762]